MRRLRLLCRLVEGPIQAGEPSPGKDAEVQRRYAGAFGWPQNVDVPVYAQFVLPEDRGIGLYQQEAFGANTGLVPTLPPVGEIGGTELYLEVLDHLDVVYVEDARHDRSPEPLPSGP